MSPRLLLPKLRLIRDMIESPSLTTSQMAKETKYSKLTIVNIRRNLAAIWKRLRTPHSNRLEKNSNTTNDKSAL
jgi:Mg2+ and Co2+ transporter CorA